MSLLRVSRRCAVRPAPARIHTLVAALGTTLVCLAATAGVTGCSREPTDPPPLTGPETFFARLALNHHAVTLALTAPYDTVQLVATPVNARGGTPPGVGAVTYTSSSAAVAVSPSGVVTARDIAQNVVIVASAYDSLRNVTRTDSALVTVTSTVAPVAAVSLQQPPGDSAKDAVTGDPCTGPKLLVARAVDAGGAELAPVPVAVQSSDSTVVALDAFGGQLRAVRPGRVTFTAVAHVYGRTLRDTLAFTIGYPLRMVISVTSRTPVGSLTPVNYFDASPGEAVDTVGVGAIVIWQAPSGAGVTPVDVVFSTPSAALATGLCGWLPENGAGDIPAWTSAGDALYGLRMRRFVRPGEYPYHTTRNPPAYPARGRLVVAPGP